PKRFDAVFRPELFADLDQMRLIQQQGSKQILDARSEDSFKGQRPLTESGLQPGHIPGSINIPYRRLLARNDSTLLPVEHLRQIISDAAVDLSKPIVTSCGSGVSAALLSLALYQLGLPDTPLFDGSWAQWGRQPDLPRQTTS
ncbi:MAG: sulfurtransferase, partial [Gammaproteobacteria bacterium]